MKPIIVALIAIALTTIGVAAHTLMESRTNGGPSGTLLAADFRASAFGRPSAAPRLTQDQAVRLVNDTYWSLSGASSLSAEYVGWTSPPGNYRRVGGRLQPYDHVDVWKIIASGITVHDPGGAMAPPPGANVATWPGSRVWHRMIFLVDDKAGQIIEATPY